MTYFPPRLLEREIADRGQSQPFLAMKRDLRMTAVEIHHGRRLVGRAVVNDDQLPIVDGLPQYAFDRLPQKAAVIVRRQIDADAWIGHS